MKFKSKSLISVILSIMMVISMILVAIPANAAVINNEPVGAASNGKMLIGDILYVDITNIEGYSSISADVIRPDDSKQTQNIPSSQIPSDGIIKLTLTADMDFTTFNNVQIFKCSKDNYAKEVMFSKAPVNGQNMIIISETYDSYTWGTYGGSSSEEYTVSSGKTSNGSFTVSPTSATQGTNVTITTKPDEGYIVDEVTVTKTGGTEIVSVDGSVNTYTFTMPAYAVTVNVTFKESATPTTQYYIGGRFRVKDSLDNYVYTYGSSDNWNASSTTGFELTDADNDGTYSLNTNCTIKELSEKLPESGTQYDPFFFIHTGKGVGTGNVWYGKTSAVLTDTTTSIKLDDKTGANTDSANGLIMFSGSSSEGSVIINFTPSTKTLSYTIEGGSPTGNYKLTDKSGNYGKVVFTVGGKVVTAANENDEVTATVTPNTGFEYVAESFSVTNDTSKKAVGTPIGTTLTFTMPASNVTATAKFALNKAEYVKTLEDGLYVDVAPDKNDTTATFVMWNNYTGVGQDAPSSGYAAHNTKDYRTLYIPANVDLSSVTLYNAFSTEVKINGQTVPADGTATVSLTETTYSADSNNTYKVQVLKGSTSSMFLYTNDGNGKDYDLPTSKKSYSGLLDKETVKASGGLCTTIKGSKVSDALDLSQVKGRGNSSWQASALLFGKYAFNMKLSSATSLFDLPKSKSFCLLANNMDDAMMRNAYIYQLAKDIGLYDSPEFEFVDIYDNGEYMGAYLVTEKVDVASKDKLIKGNSIDKLNEDKGAVFDEDNPVRNSDKTLGYANIKIGPDLDNDTEFVKKYQTTGTYLLEFEIPDRVDNEPSYFKSSQGQNVVLKNPEFATKGEVEFIRDKFNEMEALVYADTINLEELSKVMDLDSFARMYLIQEFTSNLDSAATSYYITYDCSKRLFVASPVWDYDMALGQNSGSKYDKNGNNLWANNAEAWFAKYKAMGDGKQSGSYSLQSKLATDSNFQTVIKKVWFGKNNDGFYNKVQAYYKAGGQLDTWKNQISKSISMNEERWGFIANNPARSSWGSPNTTGGNGFTGAVDFLKTSWSSKRGTWLNNQFNNYSNYSQIATPTLTAYAADGTTPLEGEVTAGDTYVIKAETSEIYVDYVLYDGSNVVDTNTNGVFTISNATSGTHSYTVKTVYNSTNEKTSSNLDVTVSATVDIESVTISSKTQVNVNEEFTLTATASPNGLTGVTYTFYKDGNAIADATNITSNTYKTKITAEGSAVYKVAATLNGKTVESSIVTVTAKTASVTQDVTIYFKTATAPAYAPSVSFDDGNATAMTKSSDLGKDYSGALTFAWYSVTINYVDTTKTHTLTFTSKRTKLNATWSGKLTSTNSYFTADNLMRDTVAVNLTGESEVKRNFFYSATNMVFDISDAKNKTLGFTVVGDKRVKMGTQVSESNGTVSVLSEPNVKSATYIQMLNANLITVSSLQSELYDVNFDGKVDVKDATYIQYALAS